MEFASVFIEYWPRFLDGTLMTLKLTFLGSLIAGLAAPFLALYRLNANIVVQVPLRIYISFMRGTPLLAQMFRKIFLPPCCTCKT